MMELKEWKFEKFKLWTDLLAITAKDYADINNGITQPSHLLPLPLPRTKQYCEVVADDLMEIEKEDNGVTKKPSRMAPTTCSTRINKGKKPITTQEGVSSNPEPSMPMGMRQKIELGMGGLSPQWVDKKELTDTDCNPSQSRLNLPHQIESCFTERERGFLRESKENKMDVSVVDPTGRVWDMNVCFWPSIKRYVFISGWTDFVRHNRIRPNVHTAQIWHFRKQYHNQKLCFAVNIARKNSQAGASCSNAGAPSSSS